MIDYAKLVEDAFANHKYRQGSPTGIAFKQGAEWLRYQIEGRQRPSLVRDSSGTTTHAADEAPTRCDGMPSSADERYLRRLLARRVAIPGGYFDDGEAHVGGIDFMREPVAEIDAKLRAMIEQAQQAADPVTDFDLRLTAYDDLAKAAKESSWIPPEYFANDWLSDCCEFLRNGHPPATVVEHERCPYCGLLVESPCDAPQQSLCSAANEALLREQKPTVTDLQRELLAVCRGVGSGKLQRVRELRVRIVAINPDAALYYGWGGSGDTDPRWGR